MFKKIFVLCVVLVLFSSIPTQASTGMDYLKTKPLIEEDTVNCKALAIIIKALTTDGQDTSILQGKLITAAPLQNITSQAFSLLGALNTDIANSLCSKQAYDGSWSNDLYTTALITYILKETNLNASNAQAGINYLNGHPNEDGGWGNDGVSCVLDTSMALLALKKSGYNDDVVQKGLNWLLLNQGGEGGWGNNINTAWVCLALQELGTNPDELQKAIDYLKSIINKDGGWGINVGEGSEPFTSALVLWSLQKYDATLTEVTKGLTLGNNLLIPFKIDAPGIQQCPKS